MSHVVQRTSVVDCLICHLAFELARVKVKLYWVCFRVPQNLIRLMSLCHHFKGVVPFSQTCDLLFGVHSPHVAVHMYCINIIVWALKQNSSIVWALWNSLHSRFVMIDFYMKFTVNWLLNFAVLTVKNFLIVTSPKDSTPSWAPLHTAQWLCTSYYTCSTVANISIIW